MGKFVFNKTDIEGVYIIEPTVYGDERGYFMETYSKTDFAEAGLDYDFVQDNQSSSFKGVLRGLHFQKAHPQAKLVRVISGEVFDLRLMEIRNAPSIFRLQNELTGTMISLTSLRLHKHFELA